MPIVFLAYTAHPVRYIGLGLCFGFVVIFNVLSLVSSRLTQLWTINGTKNEYQINIVYFLVWKAISICLVLGILSTLSMAIFDEEQQNNKQEQEQSAMLNNTYALNGTTDIEPDVIPATEIANLAKSSAIYYTFDFFFSGLVTFGLFVVTWYRPK